ncbi:MAG: 7-cyano-7-deazaguanine synthase QueC [Calditrichia bacterium]
MEKAVVLVSGGLDSCVTVAIANQQYACCFLHINYGQRTERRELQAFHDLAEYYNVKEKLIVDISYLAAIGGSALTDNTIDVPDADLSNQEIPITYVPFRNGNILSIAASWAEVLDARHLFIGAVEEDSSGYPDTRMEFLKAMENAINLGTGPEFHGSIHAPLIHMKKKDIVKKGVELEAPLHLTWSCYRNEDEACGVCVSCALRLRGFQAAGIEDPIPYKQRPKYL